jgi:hypothetical protein
VPAEFIDAISLDSITMDAAGRHQEKSTWRNVCARCFDLLNILVGPE